ncbi:ATP phosphoribosyltransferase [Haloflavibacter putidus]|uniref:ATP phosphoribosyltransferase n=1 Tax=Haloflavibacter putidus TaxID=2576776 RepID=A0A507ZPW8_9FLAO|nr:ATP phosphoribosyltransferase [Haloflavibacter putidus]TQD39057.1 ATP phosphoribosyltransferase [Haloflavibacter putidus]
MTKRLKIAVQKSGRLHEDSLQILQDAGIVLEKSKDQLKATAKNFPLDILYLRNGDIPQYVNDGVVDVGIFGENLLVEKRLNLPILLQLGFSKCSLCVAIPKEQNFTELKDLNTKKIATSYPNTVQDFLKKENLTADLHTISGSVEIAPNIGLADAVVDIVSSGNTLFKNNLKPVYTILKSEAVLVASPSIPSILQATLNQLVFRIESVLNARNYKYILLNAPNKNIDQIVALLPGMKSPTLLPLAQEGWSSLHSVIAEEDFWNVINDLKKAGAEGILVSSIEKMVR